MSEDSTTDPLPPNMRPEQLAEQSRRGRVDVWSNIRLPDDVPLAIATDGAGSSALIQCGLSVAGAGIIARRAAMEHLGRAVQDAVLALTEEAAT